MFEIEKLYYLLPKIEQNKDPSEKTIALNWALNATFQTIVLLIIFTLTMHFLPQSHLVIITLFIAAMMAASSLIYFYKKGMHINLTRTLMLITIMTFVVTSTMDYNQALTSFVWCHITLTLGTFLFSKKEIIFWLVCFVSLIFVCSFLGSNNNNNTMITPHFIFLFQIQFALSIIVLAMQLYFFAYTKTQMAIKLEKTQEALRQKLHENRNIVRILSHDIANPLTVIAITSENLKLKENNSPDDERKLKRIQVATSNIKEILDDIRTLQSIIDGTQKLNLEPCSMDQVVEKSISVFKEKIENKKLKVVYENKNIKALIDPDILANHVLNNLISNAIKYSYSGQEIHIQSVQEGNRVKLSVQDSGPGMSQQTIQNIFSLVGKSSLKGTEGEAGTGFGMPIAKDIIELMNGSIEIESIQKTENSQKHGTKLTLVLSVAS